MMAMKKYLIVSAIAIVALAVGCDDDSSKTPPQPAAPAQATPAPESKPIQTQAKEALDEGKQAVQTAVTEAKAAGQAAIDQAKPMVQEATTQIKQGAEEARQLVGDKINQATGSTSAASTTDTFDYQAKVAEAMQYVKENKLDLADKTLVQVESRKASIPVSYHPKIDSARAMIESAKKAKDAGLSLPHF